MKWHEETGERKNCGDDGMMWLMLGNLDDWLDQGRDIVHKGEHACIQRIPEINKQLM